jgi:hypothetical protein
VFPGRVEEINKGNYQYRQNQGRLPAQLVGGGHAGHWIGPVHIHDSRLSIRTDVRLLARGLPQMGDQFEKKLCINELQPSVYQC